MQPLMFRIAIVLAALYGITLQAQPRIDSYFKQDELTSSTVTTTFVDSKGIVWIGTINGLNAYAGGVWYPIKSIETSSSTTVKPLGRIKDIYEDRNQQIWLITEHGLFLYNREYWTFFPPEDQDTYYISRLFEDRSGNIWVVLEYYQDMESEMGFSLISGKLQCYIKGNWYRFDDDVAGTEVLKHYSPKNYFTDILQDRTGKLWFSTLEGIYTFDGANWKAYKEDDLGTKHIYDLLEDQDGNIWAATDDGVAKFADGSWEIWRKKDGLLSNNIYRIESPGNTSIWAFARNDLKFTGLCILDQKGWQCLTTKADLAGDEVLHLISDGSGTHTFSTTGLNYFEFSTLVVTPRAKAIHDKEYFQIVMDRKKNVWLTSSSGLYLFADGLWKSQFSISHKWKSNVLFVDKQERVWVGSENRGVFMLENGEMTHFVPGVDIPDSSVEDIFEDRHGNTWIVSKKGITKLDWNLAQQ